MPETQVDRLVAVMDRLRSDGGCPWDAEQTHETLAPYAIEEAHELAEAIESGDRGEMLGELGDVLLQVVFHARVAQEHPDEPFGIEEIAKACADKLVERHPHVFADVIAEDAEAVNANWHAIKARTMGRESVMDGVPAALPALQRAQKMLSRADRAGLDVPASSGAASSGNSIGERLLALAAEASAQGVDAEAALREAVRSFETAARETERAGARRIGE
ncbi:MazG family protein [Demequina sp. NBRC 110054]|uniref:MazG family protein n=1 Tax=Demequina sp. NBRC 110054 TaxID=1570343 RepID=UPI000A06903E|nr:MazG family protein [Demequina sp. NBRC 110054]